MVQLSFFKKKKAAKLVAPNGVKFPITQKARLYFLYIILSKKLGRKFIRMT